MIEFVTNSKDFWSMITTYPVYVIDDDDSMLESMRFLLDSLGIPSKQFDDPFSFLQQLSVLEPGCILTDLRMPPMSGLELYSTVRARRIDWPVILMSAHLDSDAEVDAQEDILELLEKPFTTEQLTRVLQQASSLLDGRSKGID